MDVGDISTGMVLSGDGNSVTLAVEDLNVTGQKAMGVDISGDSNDIDIAGNILLIKIKLQIMRQTISSSHLSG